MSATTILGIVVVSLFSLLHVTVATPSVFACPLGVGFGQGGLGFGGGGMGGIGGLGGGEICERGSFIHYYMCCDENPFRCCFEFETWAIVIFAIFLILVVGGIVFAMGRYFCARY